LESSHLLSKDFFFFPSRLGLMTSSEAKLFGPSACCVGIQSLVFHQVYKVKLDVDIK
jgi:hypothetical protein